MIHPAYDSRIHTKEFLADCEYAVNSQFRTQKRNDKAFVEATHILSGGRTLSSFSSEWEMKGDEKTEYGWGLSIYHDIKDHILHGLGFTPLTELQTIVQIAEGRYGDDPSMSESYILDQFHHEFYATGGRPLVYSPSGQRGLFDEFTPQMSAEDRSVFFYHACFIGLNIMAPRVRSTYQSYPILFDLHKPQLQLPHLKDQIFKKIHWSHEERLMMKIEDNLNFSLKVESPVHPALLALSKEIKQEIDLYKKENNIGSVVESIFSTFHHLIEL